VERKADGGKEIVYWEGGIGKGRREWWECEGGGHKNMFFHLPRVHMSCYLSIFLTLIEEVLGSTSK
jgi:hypothetical protein